MLKQLFPMYWVESAGGSVMTKKSTTFALAVIVVLNLSLPTLVAQAPSAKVHNKSTAPVARMQAAHEKPCWEVAGISKSAIAERSRIEQETRSQVQSVCNDSSLNEQQKREKIREIRQQSHQQIEALISTQQREALKACQQERAAARGGSAGHGAGGIHRGGGPCGEMGSSAPKPPSGPQ
jgi:TolA-binding protein